MNTVNILELFHIFKGEDAKQENSDPSTFSTVEDPSLRLKWTAYVESLQHHGVGDLTWDQVSFSLCVLCQEQGSYFPVRL